MSAASLGRPVASLFFRSASRPMKPTGRPSTSAVVRDAQASSNVTPEICVRMSIRRGGSPIWYTVPGWAKSVEATPADASGAPNLVNAW